MKDTDYSATSSLPSYPYEGVRKQGIISNSSNSAIKLLNDAIQTGKCDTLPGIFQSLLNQNQKEMLSEKELAQVISLALKVTDQNKTPETKRYAISILGRFPITKSLFKSVATSLISITQQKNEMFLKREAKMSLENVFFGNYDLLQMISQNDLREVLFLAIRSLISAIDLLEEQSLELRVIKTSISQIKIQPGDWNPFELTDMD